MSLTASAAIAKGQGENAADQAQADRLDRAAEYGRVAAVQTDSELRENLNVTLGNIDSVRAAAGADPSSPTTAALRDRTSFIADRDRTTRVTNILAQASQNESDADYMRQAGSYALKMGNLNAAAGVAGQLAKTNFSSFGVG